MNNYCCYLVNKKNDQMSFPNDLSVLTLCAFQQRCIWLAALVRVFWLAA